MAEANFIDRVKLQVRSGTGGNGVVHFRRDKLTPFGGPDGGDGGRGGNIVLKGNKQLWTLLHLKYHKHIFAPDGEHGKDSNKTGASGEDVIVEVPLGTVAFDEEENFLFEITTDGEEKLLLKGGRGGLGNVNFKSATNQTPMKATNGEEGLNCSRILELKLLADVGLVGFPNAGKSTLLSVLSAAKPQIASYPFTTLVPNLGIVSYRNQQSFVMADLPGIIEGAHEGKGLGHRFLRHIERNAVLLFLIACDSPDVLKEYHTLLNELKLYNRELLQKPRLIAISKCDLADDEITGLIQKELPPHIPHVFISAVAQTGLTELKDELWKLMQ